MERPDELAAEQMAAHPHHAGVQALQPGQPQPDVGAGLELEMGGRPEAVGREVEQLNRHAAGAALAQARPDRDVGAGRPAPVKAFFGVELGAQVHQAPSLSTDRPRAISHAPVMLIPTVLAQSRATCLSCSLISSPNRRGRRNRLWFGESWPGRLWFGESWLDRPSWTSTSFSSIMKANSSP